MPIGIAPLAGEPEKPIQAEMNMKTFKPYTVTCEGCIPTKMDRQEMLLAMWSARIEGTKCQCHAFRDFGYTFAKDMDLELFPEKGSDLYILLMRGFEDVHRDKLRGMVMELLESIQGVRVWDDDEERMVACEPSEGWKVEIRVATDFVLRRLHHTYEVGLNTGDDYQTLIETCHLHLALSHFCMSAFKANIGLRIRNMIRDELCESGVELLATERVERDFNTAFQAITK